MDDPDDKTNFLQGLTTMGGSGDPASGHPGFAIHMYAANADMEDTAFCNGDGDFLIPGSWSRALDGGGYGDAQDGGTQILWVSDAGTTLTLRHLVLYGGTCIRGDCATYSEDDDDESGEEESGEDDEDVEVYDSEEEEEEES